MSNIIIDIHPHPFDPELEQRTLRQRCHHSGALVSFIGVMRDFNCDQHIALLELEHYPGMTEQVLMTLAQSAIERWGLEAVTILHRVGQLTPDMPIVLVAVASAHRSAAFRACEFLIDELKQTVPLWKKERTTTGIEYWVTGAPV